MKNFYIEAETEISQSDLKPGWIKKNLGKHDECACSFLGPYHQNLEKHPKLPETVEPCLNIIIEHRGLNQKELATLLQCLILTLKTTFGEGFKYGQGTFTFEGKLIGLYQIQSRFRSGLIHLAFLNGLEDNKETLNSLSDIDLLAKSFAITIMQGYSDSIEHIKETINDK